MQTNTQQAIAQLANDAEFAAAVSTFFPSDAPAETIRQELINAALVELWKSRAAV